MNSMEEFLSKVSKAFKNQDLVKLTLSKPAQSSAELQNTYVRPVEIKKSKKLHFNYRYKTKDEAKNLDLEAGLTEINALLSEHFKIATLITGQSTYQLLQSKKGKISINKSKSNLSAATNSHDKKKNKQVALDIPYLFELGLTDANGKLIPKMADKYRQINKYLEIMENMIDAGKSKEQLKVVDMGSGKGYLTFALYDFLSRAKGLSVQMTGIELRQDLVDFCNKKAKKLGFEGLKFVNQRIEDYQDQKIDVLIALHACDTATDDALAKAIFAKANLVVCAPCCHKQVRQQVKGKVQESALLKYGIFQERHFEMVTDTIRALILEQQGYQAKVFEFVSNEHTRKNIMLVGSKSSKTNPEEATEKIAALKKEYHIDYQYLEQLVNFN